VRARPATLQVVKLLGGVDVTGGIDCHPVPFADGRLYGDAAMRAMCLVISGTVADVSINWCDGGPYSWWMPLGTVVRDVYESDDRQTMYEALELLTRGNDWSRSGVYCFWNPTKCEALYIGLASTLPARFGQHNSLRGSRPRKGNKGKEIDAWFGEHHWHVPAE
jgi:hypothetical protein